MKGQTPVLNGELHDQVKPEDCFWNISDGKLIEITLQKVWSLYAAADYVCYVCYRYAMPDLCAELKSSCALRAR